MFVTQKTLRQNRLTNALFLLLFLGVIGLLAWLSTRYSFEADWTANGRNTLSEASTALLAELHDPVTITSYATEDEAVRHAVTEIVAKYQHYKPDLTLNFVNPDLEPDTVRKLGISLNGELVIQYQGRSENLKTLSEQGLTNSLQRLARSGERWLVFVEGHGERKPLGVANHDLGQWSQQLLSKGFKTQTHNLVQNPQLPDNTRVLVLAGPQLNLLPGEVAIIQQYVNAGGNLLWLSDPSDDATQHGLMPLASQLGIQFKPGMIVDPTTQILGVSDPRFALVANYPKHAITHNIDTLTLFPQAHGLSFTPPEGWTGQSLLQTEPRSWSETGTMSGKLQFDTDKDIAGPLTLGVALSRTLSSTISSNEPDATQASADAPAKPAQPNQQQRIVVIGDGDFLANAYLGNGANLSLGINIINWLAHDDNLIDIPVRLTLDRQLDLSPLAKGIIGIGFLFVLPVLLGATGFSIWWRRRKR